MLLVKENILTYVVHLPETHSNSTSKGSCITEIANCRCQCLSNSITLHFNPTNPLTRKFVKFAAATGMMELGKGKNCLFCLIGKGSLVPVHPTQI